MGRMTDPVTAEKQFDVLFGTLCEIQTSLRNSTAQVAGFLLLIIGWIATSETAFAISQKSFNLLKKLDFMPPEHYEDRNTNVSVLLVFIGGNLFLALLAAVLLLRVR